MGLGLMMGVHPSPLVRLWVGLLMMGVHLLWVGLMMGVHPRPLRIGWVRVAVRMGSFVRVQRSQLWDINDMVHLATIMT